jgi:putative hydrolase of the HAD superfamily
MRDTPEKRTTMPPITAIGFDLFDTLVTVERLGIQEALDRLVRSLRSSGLGVEEEAFLPVYRAAVRQLSEETRRDGRETHNRFWISTALQHLGHQVSPDDHRVALAVEAYFSGFLEYAALIPATLDMLTALRGRYRLGLLSNFTHGPAAREIIARLGLTPFFDVLLVSGELGYRKPHSHVFRELVARLHVPKEHIAFVGDDVEADIHGAQQAGLQPIWVTYTQARKTPSPLGTMPELVDGSAPAVPAIASWDELLRLLDTA